MHLASVSKPLPLRRVIVSGLILAATSCLLLLHARRFDFFCDDAYISLRYSKNLVELGAPLYNAGERVEGYTSPLWMVLVALLYRCGLSPLHAAQALGGLSALATLSFTWKLWQRIQPHHTWMGGGLILSALAASAPLAAWTFGGLETPLFTALVVLSVSLMSDLCVGQARGYTAGLAFAAATYARPEGMLLFWSTWIVACIAQRHSKEGRTELMRCTGAYLFLVGALLCWRYMYYGDLLPNTFYVKSTGIGLNTLQQGLQYVGFAAREIGLWIVGACGVSLMLPVPRGGTLEAPQATLTPTPNRRSSLIWLLRVTLIPFVAYVVYLGGDFLDLYRFFVPLLPLLFVSIGLGVSFFLEKVETSLRQRFPRHQRGVVCLLFLTGVCALGLYAQHQQALGSRALRVEEPGRARLRLEPLGWTRLWALRWAAAGRWIQAHKQGGDTTAIGAAGALPYYAEVPNLDLFGLCDTFVAHKGVVLGSRPGHQRFAPAWYVLARKPTFWLFAEAIHSPADPEPTPDTDWNAKGYVWADMLVDEQYGAPEPFAMRMLLRMDRAQALRHTCADLRVAIP